MSAIEFDETDDETLLDLRHLVLRAGRPRETARMGGDRDAGTLHAAARQGGRVVGCASFMRSTVNRELAQEAGLPEGDSAWQLRGMATHPDVRGTGAGARLLDWAEARLREREPSVRVLWCNARTGAVGFYERQGWRVVSAEFDVPEVGPHVRMVKVRE
jgi:GNAT superfamily N-acetyltransferase